METISNEEIAINIRGYLTSTIMADGKTKGLNLLSEKNKRCADLINIYKLVEMSATEAMEFKDKQFQKVLDYAENCYGVFSFEQRKNFINHIKEIFYGKE